MSVSLKLFKPWSTEEFLRITRDFFGVFEDFVKSSGRILKEVWKNSQGQEINDHPSFIISYRAYNIAIFVFLLLLHIYHLFACRCRRSEIDRFRWSERDWLRSRMRGVLRLYLIKVDRVMIDCLLPQHCVWLAASDWLLVWFPEGVSFKALVDNTTQGMSKDDQMKALSANIQERFDDQSHELKEGKSSPVRQYLATEKIWHRRVNLYLQS